MADFEYGPVEMFLIGFAGARPGPAIVGEIVKLLESDTVRLLDLVFATRDDDGELTVLEIDELEDEHGLAGLEVAEIGLAGQEDIDDLAPAIAPGTSAALLVIEHVWAREFAQALYSAGGAVLHTERIPAPVVNEVVAATSA
jgi:Family of unknown function (DUF6325)